MKHTPGPWGVEGDLNLVVLDPKKKGVKLGVITSNDIPHEQRIANVRLASAAPDLKDAVIGLKDAVDELLAECGKKRAADWSIINDALIAAEQALRKAQEPS